MKNEQERAEFEAWLYLSQTEYEPSDLNKREIEIARLAFIEGRAAMQSQKPEPVVTLVEARDEAMRFALSEMVKWYEKISLGNNPAFQYYDLAKKALQSADAMQSQDREDVSYQRDVAIGMLAHWVVAIEKNGTGWDDWDKHFKNAKFRDNPIRKLLDKAIDDARHDVEKL